MLELADVGVDDEIKTGVHTAATAALEEQVGKAAEIRGVQGIKSGQNFLIEIEIAAPKSWDLTYANGVEAAVRESVSAKVKGVRRVQIRFVSDEKHEDAFADEFVAGRLSDGQSEEHNHDHGHDPEHEHGHEHANGEATAVEKQSDSVSKSRRANGSTHK